MGAVDMLGYGLFGQVPELVEFGEMMKRQRQEKEQAMLDEELRQAEDYIAHGTTDGMSAYRTEIQCDAMRLVDLEEACERERKMRQARRSLEAKKKAQADAEAAGGGEKIDWEAESKEMAKNKLAIWTSCDARAAYEWIRRHADFDGSRAEINSLRRQILEGYGLGDLESMYSKRHPTLQIYLPPEEEAALFPDRNSAGKAEPAESSAAPAPKA